MKKPLFTCLGLSALLLSLCPLCSGVSCDVSDPVSSSPYYKYYCGQTFVVGFPGGFSPYSWKVDASEEEDETLLYKDSLSSYATVDGWVGLDPDIMDEIANFLGFNYTVKEVEVPGANDTWTSILREYMTQIDIMGNNFALSTEREDIGLFTDKQVDMSGFLVQISTKQSSSYTYQSAFRFVTPFSSGVWLALFVCMVMSALVVWILDWSYATVHSSTLRVACVIEDEENCKEDFELKSMSKEEKDDHKTLPEDHVTKDAREHPYIKPSPTPKQPPAPSSGSDDQICLFDSLYFAFASFTGAAKFAPAGKGSKIFVASWSFLVLIVISTYTANLAATLTQNNGYEEEIQSIDDAIQLGVKTCVSTRNVYYPSLPVGYSNTDDLAQLYPYLEVNGLWQDLYEYMANGTCRVALFNREDITASLQDQQYCDLQIVGGVSDSDGNGYADSELFYFGTGLVTNFDNAELNVAINAALQYLLKSGTAQSLREKWAGGLCTLDETTTDEDVTSIQLRHLAGPFVIHFAVGCLIILHAIARYIVIKYDIDVKYLNWFFNISADDTSVTADGIAEDLDEEDVTVDSKILRELISKISSLENEIRHGKGNVAATPFNPSPSMASIHEFSDSDLALRSGDGQNKWGSMRRSGKRSNRNRHALHSTPSIRVLR